MGPIVKSASYTSYKYSDNAFCVHTGSTNLVVTDNRWFQQLSPYVDKGNDKGVNKGCDLIVIWLEANVHTTLVFDLKSDKPKVEATQKQLDNSELVFEIPVEHDYVHYGIATDGFGDQKKRL